MQSRQVVEQMTPLEEQMRRLELRLAEVLKALMLALEEQGLAE